MRFKTAKENDQLDWGFVRGLQSLMSLQVHVLNKSYVIVAMRTPAPRCSSPPDRLYRPWWPAGLRASVRGDGHEKAVENEKVSYYITLVCAVEAPTTTTSTAAQAPSCAALQPTAAISFPRSDLTMMMVTMVVMMMHVPMSSSFPT